jgi:hypothetical protein
MTAYVNVLGGWYYAAALKVATKFWSQNRSPITVMVRLDRTISPRSMWLD